MTKPIIINGVDVSGCIYIDENTIPQDCGVNNSFCYEFNQCYYKQLQRKEKEFKELKNKLEKAENNCIKVFNLFSELGEKYKKLKRECEKYKKCIETIKSRVKGYKESCDKFCDCNRKCCASCFIGGAIELGEDIEMDINEVENEKV